MQICKRCTSCSLLWEGREDSSAPGERLLAPGEELSNKEKELATDAAASDVDFKHFGQGGVGPLLLMATVIRMASM